MRIWKLCFIDETTNKTDVFNSTEILDDKALKKEFIMRLWNGGFNRLENINKIKEKVETLTLVEIADCYKKDGWHIISKEF